jgi:hypothetical protein
MTLIRDTGNALKKSTQLTLYSSYPKAVLMSYFHRKKPTQRKLQVRHDMLNENSMKWSMQYYGRNSIVFGEKSKQLFRRRAFRKAQTTTHGGFRFIKTRAYNIVLISPLRSCLAKPAWWILLNDINDLKEFIIFHQFFNSCFCLKSIPMPHIDCPMNSALLLICLCENHFEEFVNRDSHLSRLSRPNYLTRMCEYTKYV